MNAFVSIVEKTAGYFIGVLALITFGEALLRYGFNKHIPDGFVIGQTMQGIAICWGIATATYADRQITVDILYELVGRRMRRAFDIVAHTINLLFLALFGSAMTFKVFDILQRRRDFQRTAHPDLDRLHVGLARHPGGGRRRGDPLVADGRRGRRPDAGVMCPSRRWSPSSAASRCWC